MTILILHTKIQLQKITFTRQLLRTHHFDRKFTFKAPVPNLLMDMLSKQKGLRKDFILNANFQLCNSGQVTQLFNLLPKL